MEVGRQRKLADEQGLPYEIPLELSGTIEERVRGGHVSGINSADPRINNRLQRIAVEESRLGIPLLVSQDVLHGFRTVFPIPLAGACSWNPDLIERAAHVGRRRGVHRGHQLVLRAHGRHRARPALGPHRRGRGGGSLPGKGHGRGAGARLPERRPADGDSASPPARSTTPAMERPKPAATTTRWISRSGPCETSTCLRSRPPSMPGPTAP